MRVSNWNLQNQTRERVELPAQHHSPKIVDDPEDIRALTKAVRRGDDAAFARFYDRYSFRIYKYLLVLARGDEHSAQEVCQGIIIKLSRRLEVFENERQLWGWICKLTRNAFLDHCRAKARENRNISMDEIVLRLPAPGPPEHVLAQLLREAVADLAPQDSELLNSFYLDKRPLQELASERGLTYKAIEARLWRLRQKLKNRLLSNLRDENLS
jgi:RNA polymerase sigma factor (sigma-70 family)